jgi:glutathione peroxidase
VFCFRGHVLLIANVASKCGFTKSNYEQLSELYEKYAETKGLRIIGFPSNQFKNQEPRSEPEIKEYMCVPSTM